MTRDTPHDDSNRRDDEHSDDDRSTDDRRPGDGRADDRTDDVPERRPGGFVGSIRRFLDTLAEMETRGESVRKGSTSAGNTWIDYTIRIGALVDDDPRSGRSPSAGSPSGAASTSGASASSTPTSVRETDDGVVVHLDLPGVAGETVATGVDGRTLVIGVGDAIHERVSLPRAGLTVVEGSYRNGVFEVHLE